MIGVTVSVVFVKSTVTEIVMSHIKIIIQNQNYQSHEIIELFV